MTYDLAGKCRVRRVAPLLLSFPRRRESMPDTEQKAKEISKMSPDFLISIEVNSTRRPGFSVGIGFAAVVRKRGAKWRWL